MLPLGARPALDHVVDECADAGASEIIIVTRPTDTVVAAHLAATHGRATPVRVVVEDLRHGYGNAAPLLTMGDRLRGCDLFAVVGMPQGNGMGRLQRLQRLVGRSGMRQVRRTSRTVRMETSPPPLMDQRHPAGNWSPTRLTKRRISAGHLDEALASPRLPAARPRTALVRHQTSTLRLGVASGVPGHHAAPTAGLPYPFRVSTVTELSPSSAMSSRPARRVAVGRASTQITPTSSQAADSAG